jgi:hypothetical protein
MKRYNMEICHCVIGPHVESAEDAEGDWVRRSELEAEALKAVRLLEREEGPRVAEALAILRGMAGLGGD